MVAEKTRTSIIKAFMALLAEQPWETVTMTEVAGRAGVKPSVLRGAYDGRIAILADFFRRIDAKVLDGLDPDLADEPPLDRLFDVLMSRLDALAPDKPALRALADEAWRNPALAAKLNRIAVRSQAWMLSAAGIESAGLHGAAKTQGLAIAFARVMGVWFTDEDPGQARTMAALDTELKRGAAILGRIDRAGAFLASLKRFSRSARRGGARRTTGGPDSAGDTDHANPA
ncbi:TetR/AcrR family transcriptional regulator [Breoghania sp. L-A4]|uniref:TetR/AcrR family transcriptional regulator n=1 Tax=Breoghania sp. L-A4 TaxID=2304600 RepID=UPI000E35D292|nr:TetR/AcrR family transcriptional regulator [Breoghania sp. L-A4]AXS41445.1 TetR/AcrR family transcriptional regulator [Breoghania sp. L-A4]